jgi:hypothetical protein
MADGGGLLARGGRGSVADGGGSMADGGGSMAGGGGLLARGGRGAMADAEGLLARRVTRSDVGHGKGLWKRACAPSLASIQNRETTQRVHGWSK